MNSPFYAGEKWCVRRRGDCLNHDAEWEWEPMPSSRDDDFYARCRFDTLAEAVAAYNRSANNDLSVRLVAGTLQMLVGRPHPDRHNNGDRRQRHGTEDV